MAESSGDLISITAPNRLQITKWKVRKGSKVSQGAVLGLYKLINLVDPENREKIKEGKEEKEEDINTTTTDLSSSSNVNNNNIQKLKSSHVGTVSDILAKEGQEINEGSIVLQIQGCSHPTVMKDMCADCGADLRTEMGVSGCRKENVSATVAMVHSIPELIVSEEQALELGRADEIRLKKTRKLVLLVDLDQTLIHTTNDNIPPNLKGIHHFQLWQGMNLLWYHTRIRPHTQQFLENISKMYELHICTFGVRMYAHTIARFIDPAGKFFSHRILSRDECFNAMSKTANLKSLFPCGDAMVCIIDDREDVWNYAPNLIHVKPYRFFQGTADINAPTGFSKKENDAKPLTHQVRKVPGSTNSSEKGKGSSTSNKNKKKKNDDKGKKSSEESTLEKKLSEESTLGKSESAKEVKDVVVDPVPKKEDPPDTAPKDIKVASEDNADDSAKQTSKNSAEEKLSEDSTKVENPASVESKEDEEKESKTDEDSDETKDEDSEGLSDDSSMSGMSLCGNSSTNATSNKDDSNVDENDDDNDNDNEDKMIEWEDEDDYLFYLEEVLQRIHKAYFDISDQLMAEGKSSEMKLDLKAIIPYVKRKVLKGCNICFSGVIPLNLPMVKSRAYNVALNLGANVHDTFIPCSSNRKTNYTTHLIANKMGTSKVHAAKRAKKVSIVSPDWLWSCAERWDHVDEKLFPLKEKGPLDSDNGRSSPELPKDLKSASRKHKSSDDDIFKPVCKVKKLEDSDSSEEEYEDDAIDMEAAKAVNLKKKDDVKKMKRAGSRYNPLYSFSDEERANMDKELEELMDEDDSDSDEHEAEAQLRNQVLSDPKCDTSSEDSLSGEFPRGWNDKKWSKRRSSKKKATIKRDESISEDSEASINEKYEKTIEVFATHESDSSNDDTEGESIGSIDEEIAEAVEKEFLAR